MSFVRRSSSGVPVFFWVLCEWGFYVMGVLGKCVEGKGKYRRSSG